jgi:hypothetical protein
MEDDSRKQVNIHFHKFESEKPRESNESYELQIRLVERELLNDKECEVAAFDAGLKCDVH